MEALRLHGSRAGEACDARTHTMIMGDALPLAQLLSHGYVGRLEDVLRGNFRRLCCIQARSCPIVVQCIIRALRAGSLVGITTLELVSCEIRDDEMIELCEGALSHMQKLHDSKELR